MLDGYSSTTNIDDLRTCVLCFSKHNMFLAFPSTQVCDDMLLSLLSSTSSLACVAVHHWSASSRPHHWSAGCHNHTRTTGLLAPSRPLISAGCHKLTRTTSYLCKAEVSICCHVVAHHRSTIFLNSRRLLFTTAYTCISWLSSTVYLSTSLYSNFIIRIMQSIVQNIILDNHIGKLLDMV